MRDDPEGNDGVGLAPQGSLRADGRLVLGIDERKQAGVEPMALEVLLAEPNHLGREIAPGDVYAKRTMQLDHRGGLTGAEFVDRTSPCRLEEAGNELQSEEIRRVLGIGPEQVGVVLLVVGGRAAVVVLLHVAHGSSILGAVGEWGRRLGGGEWASGLDEERRAQE